MTPEQQRIAIATACGWQNCTTNHYASRSLLKGSLIGTNPDSERTQYIPNYCENLNAMHDAENCLINTPKLEEDYYFALKRNFRATAAERCESLLKVIGKWTDDEKGTP
jgi:hypothetical protein